MGRVVHCIAALAVAASCMGGAEAWGGRAHTAPLSLSLKPGSAGMVMSSRAEAMRLRGGAGNRNLKGATEVESETTLEKKISPNRLLVEVPDSTDNSICAVSTKRMEELGIFNGDTVKIKGRRGRETVCVLVPDDKLPEDRIRLPDIVAKALHVNVGSDRVIVSQFSDIKNAKRVHIVPFKDSLEGFEGDVFEVFLKPYFFENYRPLHVGEAFSITDEKLDITIDFKVMQIDDEDTEYGVVAPETVVYTEGAPLDRSEDPARSEEIGYDDVGGLSKQISQLRELVELPLRHPEIFQRVGTNPPRGVLLHGPAGCGKTMIGKALASECGAFFFLINGPEVLSGKAGDSENHLRRCFEEATKNAPSVIWIDEVEVIAGKRDKANGEVEKRIVSQLITLMDGIKENVMVVAATNKPNDIDQSLRRFGRFSKEIEVVSPDDNGRHEILKIKTRNMQLAEDVDLKGIAHDAHGYTGGDLAQLVLEAGVQCIRDQTDLLDLEEDELPMSQMRKIRVRQKDMFAAMANTNPSSLRETSVEMPDVTWADVGGLEKVKQELMETVMYPVEYAHKYEKFGMNPSRGVLLYGPSGCGKTLMAKAIANEAKTNFISVKGPELLSMWMGESESNVRDLFAKARGAAPCEPDPYGDGRSGRAEERGVHRGVQQARHAGPRRVPPGEADQLVYIPVPDVESRIKIFESCLRKSPLADDVVLSSMAENTEGFSGADLNEICQRACKLAIREEISQWTEWAATQEDPKNPTKPFESKVHQIGKHHFEESFKFARRSVTDKDVRKYETFRQKMLAAAAGAADKVEE
eukprot:CAMPEP_0169459816 /NCGR_PEP_ID=MMETSP1042-20121227/18150_1 /TAXON_ID=464988 /ORGANISM="Hemiselmis andersenii, Strain CCMP1180" /LENGTH=807 /DNA_ID=CAMNT_0009572255 /DNA_START=50 /DNA_END=2471 /DNA_ORIENTATION=+